MNPLSGNGEIELLANKTSKIVAFDGLEDWQRDQLTSSSSNDSSSSNNALMNIDSIVIAWMEELEKEQWEKIERQKSLFGIPLPDKWIRVWRFILKEDKLRDATGATCGGKSIGSFGHLWNVWAESCLDKYLDPLDKELLRMVDEGYLYNEIGDYLLAKYGETFWKPRKKDSSTTTTQVINNYLYWKMPNKIVRGELTDCVLRQLKQRARKGSD